MSEPAIDISGLRCGRLTTLAPVGKDNIRRIVWLCRCDCGSLSLAAASDLRGGRVKSCGGKDRDPASRTSVLGLFRGVPGYCDPLDSLDIGNALRLHESEVLLLLKDARKSERQQVDNAA